MINKCENNLTVRNQSLQIDLLNKLREYFNLHTQAKLGQLKQLHLLKKTRRHIARMKSCLLNKQDFYKK